MEKKLKYPITTPATLTQSFDHNGQKFDVAIELRKLNYNAAGPYRCNHITITAQGSNKTMARREAISDEDTIVAVKECINEAKSMFDGNMEKSALEQQLMELGYKHQF